MNSENLREGFALSAEAEGVDHEATGSEGRRIPGEYYGRRGVLAELTRRPVEFALDEELRRKILRGQRSRRLQNLSIKLDAAQIQALRKIATRRAIPYQTLIPQWLADGIGKELRLSGS